MSREAIEEAFQTDLEAAISLAEKGIPVYPAYPADTPGGKGKAPWGVTGGFKGATTNPDQIKTWWERNPSASVAIPTGKPSGIYALDVDAKNDPTGTIIERMKAKSKAEGIDGLFKKMPRVVTFNKGLHFYFRSQEDLPTENLAEAQRIDSKGGVIIETRAKGAAILVPPSKGYGFESGDFDSIPILTPKEIETLLSFCRSFNEVTKKPKHVAPVARIREEVATLPQLSPGDDYNARGDVEAILKKHGWTTHGDKRWTRPGKGDGCSATLNAPECPGMLYVFSSSAPPFNSNESYKPFAVYALLEHGGDFSAATKALRAGGYGGEIPTLLAGDLDNDEKEPNDLGDLGADIDKKKKLTPLDKLIASNIATPEAIEAIEEFEREAVFIMDGIALGGQATVIYAAPNVGKTLLILSMLVEQKRNGVHDRLISYINADDTLTGGKEKAKILIDSGINMVIPDRGKEDSFNIADFPLLINQLVTDGTAREHVFVLDTLKKFTSLMDKEKAANFGKLSRRFVQAGGTIIALAHVNKHKGADGKSIYEGTGDIQSDYDACYNIELITPKEDTDRLVTFENTKNRGPNLLAVSYRYNSGQGLSWTEIFESVKRVPEQVKVATSYAVAANQRFKNDIECIQFLCQIIAQGNISRRDLIRMHCGKGFSGGMIEGCLDRYDHTNLLQERQFWTYNKGQTGGKIYSINEQGIQMSQKLPPPSRH